jgi:MFS family permease
MAVTSAAAPPPAPRRLYHGTKVVIALFLAGFVVYGGGLYGFVLFVPPLTAEFHWSRAATSGLVTAFWLSAPMILLGGAAIDRFGANRLLIAGIVIEALCVTLLSTVGTFAEMYLLRAAMGFGKVMFAVTLPYVVSRWFARHYSLGLGVVWSGWQFGGLVLAPVTGEIIVRYGWRTACLAIAAGLLTLALVPVLATLRPRAPRDLGQGLDGDPLLSASGKTPPGKGPPGASASPRSGGAAESMRMLVCAPMFWLIALSTVFFYTTYGGLLTHEASVVEGAGFSPRLASVVLGSTAGFAGLGSLSVGWLLDRYSVRIAGVGLHVLLLAGAVSLLLVDRMHSPVALVTYAAFFGVTIGGSDVYFVAVLRRRFAAISVAHSYSAWYFCEILTLLLAGPAAGHIFDLTGNYAATLAMLAGSAALAFLCSYFVWRPVGLERGGRDAPLPV